MYETNIALNIGKRLKMEYWSIFQEKWLIAEN